ncbi:MAG: 16S rRNA (adenine(1518)-N(6)/adenine(1519)-N(6))-dimethyltransferase RsmA [Halothece sp.]
MKPRKRFAQHWLKSQESLQKIIEAAELKANDEVLEIGPGTGILTRQLINRVNQVTAVEVDRALFEKLQHKFHQENLTLIQGDILHLDLSSWVTPLPNKVVANIPYNITGPILERLLGSISAPKRQYEKIILLVQKEIAQRLCAKAGSKTFGALSVRGQYLAHCELISIVPAKAFSPPPKVDSAIISLIPRPFPLTVNSPELLETLVKLGFANRRKMLRNNLKSLISPQQLQRILEQLEINPLARAEDISVSNWVKLCNQLG